MTFGKIKSLVEKNLVESYTNQSQFKKTLREFKHNILENKNLSKLYSIYDDLNKPQGLSKEEAELFLSEGIDLIRHLLENVNLPKVGEEVVNNYTNLDNLVYFNNVNILERVKSKKAILENLQKQLVDKKESINIPLKSMVGIANQTIQNYLENLDESARKEVFHILANKPEDLEKEFIDLKESTITKLQGLIETQTEDEMVSKLNETIEKIKLESFDQINYIKLKDLQSSIVPTMS